MKHTREYVILLAVIVGVGLYLLLGSSNGVHYELPQLDTVSAGKADRVDIRTGNRSLTLREANGTWRIADEGYEADRSKVSEMIRKSSEPGITALVSESGDYSRYHLDEQGRIEVEVRQGGETVRKLYLGKSSGEVGNTYIRLPGDQNIYMAEKDLRGAFDTTASKLRDRTVFRIDPEKAVSVRLKSRNGTRQFRRVNDSGGDANATEGTVWETKQGQTVQDESIRDLLRSLEDLRCRKYTGGLSRNGTRYTITVKTDNRHSLSLFVPQGKNPGTYEAKSSQRPDPFELAGYLGKEVISSAKKLLKAPTQSKGSK